MGCSQSKYSKNVATGHYATSQEDSTQSESMRAIRFVHFSDVFNLDPVYFDEPIGGAARFATKVQGIRNDLIHEHGYKLQPKILFGGNCVGPSPMSAISRGAHMIEMMNLLRVDYGTFGPHDFDYGFESLKDLITNGSTQEPISAPSSTKWIMSNYSDFKTGLPIVPGDKVHKWVSVQWPIDAFQERAVCVGIMSLCDNWLSGHSRANCDFKYESMLGAARNVMEEMKAGGVEVVLAMVDSGYDACVELKQALPDIDIVLASRMSESLVDLDNRIVASGEEFRWVPLIQLFLHDDGTKTLQVEMNDVATKCNCDTDTHKLMRKYRTLRQQKWDQILFKTSIDLDVRDKVIQTAENAFCNWICDICEAAYTDGDGEHIADFAILQAHLFEGKSMKIPSGRGGLTYGNFFNIFPRRIMITVLELTGEEIIETLSLGAQELPESCPRLHQCSKGLKYHLTLKARALHATGFRSSVGISNVRVNGKPIDRDETYRVAVDNLLASGMGGFDWMREATRVVPEVHTLQLHDLVFDYCKDNLHGEEDLGKGPAVVRGDRISINEETFENACGVCTFLPIM